MNDKAFRKADWQPAFRDADWNTWEDIRTDLHRGEELEKATLLKV